GRSPIIHAWIVSPTRVQIRTGISSPDDHLTAGPDGRKILSANRRVGGAGGYPTVGGGIVSPTGVQIAAAIMSAPDDHFSASPHCCVAHPGSGSVGCAGRCPRIINASVWAGRYWGKRILIALLSPSPEFQWFLMIGVEVSYKTLSQHRPSHTFSNYKRI